MNSACCFSLCLTLFLLSHAAVNSHPSKDCCLKTNNVRIHKHRVVDYTIQRAGICPINAIILITRHRGVKCIDPDFDPDWIKAVTRMVDQKKKAKQNGNGNKKRNKKKKPKKGRQ